MSSGGSKLECYNLFNNLVCVPHLLVDVATVIDLRNESSVAGRIADVDG